MFLQDRLHVVYNYDRVNFTREARLAIRRYPRFACLKIFAQCVDFSRCYFSPKSKITRNLGKGVKKGLALFAGCQLHFPRKRKFVLGEKDSSDPNGRRHSREKKRSSHFVRSLSSLKRATLFTKGQQPCFQERKINRA